MTNATAVADIGALITNHPGMQSGRPIIAGTGVTVRSIADWYKLGLLPEEIAARLGHLTVAQVFAALTYYHANREAIETDFAEEEATHETSQAEQTSSCLQWKNSFRH